MPTKIVEQTQQCPYCLLPTVLVTVEQLLSTRGEVVASTIIDKASCTNADCAPNGRYETAPPSEALLARMLDL